MDIPYNFGRWLPQREARELAAHTDDGLEIVYVARGEVTWDFEGKPVHSPHRTFTYTWPWQPHGSATQTVPSLELYWFVFPLDRAYNGFDDAIQFARSLGFKPSESKTVVQGLRANAGTALPANVFLHELVLRLFQALETSTAHDEATVRCLCQTLLLELSAADRRGRHENGAQMAQNRVRAFLKQVRDEHANPWTLSSMANACQLGRTQFTRHMEELAGDSPMRFLNRIRIEAARKQLVESDASITDIAFACGFSSSQYFANVFKAYTGRTPSDFRKTPFSESSHRI
jgi:AraC-like DNA-binding protein